MANCNIVQNDAVSVITQWPCSADATDADDDGVMARHVRMLNTQQEYHCTVDDVSVAIVSHGYAAYWRSKINEWLTADKSAWNN